MTSCNKLNKKLTLGSPQIVIQFSHQPIWNGVVVHFEERVKFKIRFMVIVTEKILRETIHWRVFATFSRAQTF